MGVLFDIGRYYGLQVSRAAGDLTVPIVISGLGTATGIISAGCLGLKTDLGIQGVGIGYTTGPGISAILMALRLKNILPKFKNPLPITISDVSTDTRIISADYTSKRLRLKNNTFGQPQNGLLKKLTRLARTVTEVTVIWQITATLFSNSTRSSPASTPSSSPQGSNTPSPSPIALPPIVVRRAPRVPINLEEGRKSPAGRSSPHF